MSALLTYDTHSKSVRYPGSVVLLDKMGKNLYSLFYPCSRGDSGALYPQSATEGVMAGFGLSSCEAAHGKWR